MNTGSSDTPRKLRVGNICGSQVGVVADEEDERVCPADFPRAYRLDVVLVFGPDFLIELEVGEVERDVLMRLPRGVIRRKCIPARSWCLSLEMVSSASAREVQLNRRRRGRDASERFRFLAEARGASLRSPDESTGRAKPDRTIRCDRGCESPLRERSGNSGPID